MFKDNITSFVLKRVLILYILLSLPGLLFSEGKWYIPIGLLLGGICSILRFSMYAQVFKGKGNMLAVFATNQLLLAPLLFITYRIDMHFFVGMTAGILLVPLALFMNSITEILRITHNHFE